MRLDDRYDVSAPPLASLEPIKFTPWQAGRVEYGWATSVEVETDDLSAIPTDVVRRMDAVVIRNFAQFQVSNPDLDLSNVQIVDGPILRQPNQENVEFYTYPRGWYATTQPGVA